MRRNNSTIPVFCSQKKFLNLFSQLQKNEINGESIINHYIDFFSYLNAFISKNDLVESLYTFLNEKKDYCFQELKEKVIDKINEFQKSGEYTYFFNLFTIVIHQIFDKKISLTIFYDLTDFTNLGDFNSSYRLFVDKECRFYFRKTYNKISDKVKKLEDEIIHRDFTKDGLNFIVHTKYPSDGNKQMIPYFPNQTLRTFLDNTEMSIADKLVIIKEIGHGFDELHTQQIYHLNINSSSVVVNNDKDSYIFNFAHDIELEQHQTKLVPSFYYRHPDLCKDQKDENDQSNPKNLTKIDKTDENCEEEIKRNISYDLYSFGVLAHEIITKKSPEERFGNATRETRINRLKKNYKEFLFSEFKDVEEFDSKYGIGGIGEIITKCMNTDASTNTEDETRYSSFKELLTDLEEVIEGLSPSTREEINTRIKNSTKSTEYEYKISDLIVNYYYGNVMGKKLVLSFIEKLKTSETSAQPQFNSDDLILQLLYLLKFKDNDYTIFLLEGIFNRIICDDFLNKNSYKEQNLTWNQLRLMSLSNFANSHNELMEFKDEYDYANSDFMSNMIPITTLDKFNEFDQNGASIPIFAFFIAEEISTIHSFGMHHGELSLNSIGIYYDSATEAFIPSVILFYSLFKNTQNEEKQKQKSKTDDIEKLQRKDVSKFKQIIQSIDKTRRIPEQIYENESIDMIVFKLYNFILKYCDQGTRVKFTQNYHKSNYSSLQLTYPTIHRIFTSFSKSLKVMSHFLLNEESGGFLNLERPLLECYELICYMSDNECKQFDDDISKAERIEQILREIKVINDSAIDEYFDSNADYGEDHQFIIKIENEILRVEGTNESLNLEVKKHLPPKNLPKFSSYYRFKTKDFKPKLEKLRQKEIFRSLDLDADLKEKSFRFFFQRYINNLTPNINYRITIRIIERNNTDITPEFVINAANRMGLNAFEETNGCIVFEIKK